jgi:adenylosuccinate synthase
VTPVYKNLGWKQDLTGMTTYDELPVELKEYIDEKS